jgi:signal transduction histidine kinase
MPELPSGTVTFLLTDLTGSTQLWEQHPEAMQEAQAGCIRAVVTEITAHSGAVFKVAGDNVLSAFETAPDALRAALAIVRLMPSIPWVEPGPPPVCLAIHTDSVEPRDDDYVGPAVNRAVRLVGAGHAHQILLSAATAALVREEAPTGVGLRDLGEHQFRGVQTPQRIYQVLAPDLPADFPPPRSQTTLAEVEERSRHKSEFLAGMSHELRTPLNAIIGFSEVLLAGMAGDLTAKQAEYIDDILSSGQHLLALINDVLDLSKVEAGRMELEVTSVSLPALIESTMRVMRERASRGGIGLSVEIDSDIGPIEGDERKLKQVLVNLFSNAVKFTPVGGRVAVIARCDGDALTIAVRDTGVGIPPEEQQRIFEEFRQAGGGATREGTGLGLALARRFVELHGGAIGVESRPGAGSTFTIVIPQPVPVAVG